MLTAEQAAARIASACTANDLHEVAARVAADGSLAAADRSGLQRQFRDRVAQLWPHVFNLRAS